MADELKFVAADHTYHIGEQELISVTTVLREAGLIDTRWYNDEAALRGTTVAIATMIGDEGGLDRAAVPEQWRGYVAAWERFKGEVGFVVQCAEYVVSNQAMGVAGKIDRVGCFHMSARDRGDWILELKTGAQEEWHWLQLAGYRECVDFSCQVAVVYLKEDGGYTFVRRDFSQHLRDRETFKAAVKMTQWKRRYARG